MILQFDAVDSVFFHQAEEVKHAAETKYDMCCDNARREVSTRLLIVQSEHLILKAAYPKNRVHVRSFSNRNETRLVHV